MNKIYPYEIIAISKAYDKKTSIQKVLKLVEEVGELAQAILINEEAHGTQYRDKSQFSIVEELADVYLCLFAIFPGYDISEEAFNEEVGKKLNKWTNKIGLTNE